MAARHTRASRGSAARMLPEDPTQRTLALVGLGVVGAGVSLGGVLWLVRSQILEGAPLRVQVDVDSEVKDILRAYQPYVAKLATDGMNQNVRLFPTRKTK